MSYRLVDAILARAHPGLRHVDRWVLSLLARRANDRGECFPSMRLIAAEGQVALTTVVRAIAQLEHVGVLVVVRRHRRCSRYRIRWVVDARNVAAVSGALPSSRNVAAVSGALRSVSGALLQPVKEPEKRVHTRYRLSGGPSRIPRRAAARKIAPRHPDGGPA
jgi:hypothetical protein